MDRGPAAIIGFGDGLSASLDRELARDHSMTPAARRNERIRGVAQETGAETVLLDATVEEAVAGLLDALSQLPLVVTYNPTSRDTGPVAEFDFENGRRAVDVTAIGAILNPDRQEPGDKPYSMLRPDAIARTYRHLIQQDRSTWSNDMAVRPWVERF